MAAELHLALDNQWRSGYIRAPPKPQHRNLQTPPALGGFADSGVVVLANIRSNRRVGGGPGAAAGTGTAPKRA
jgi:hypothetical protein